MKIQGIDYFRKPLPYGVKVNNTCDHCDLQFLSVSDCIKLMQQKDSNGSCLCLSMVYKKGVFLNKNIKVI